MQSCFLDPSAPYKKREGEWEEEKEVGEEGEGGGRRQREKEESLPPSWQAGWLMGSDGEKTKFGGK